LLVVDVGRYGEHYQNEEKAQEYQV
jgi:hypothetical protein